MFDFLWVFDPFECLHPADLTEVVTKDRPRARPKSQVLLLASRIVSTLGVLLQLKESRDFIALMTDSHLNFFPVGEGLESFEGGLVDGVEVVVCSDSDANAVVVGDLLGIHD